MKRKARSNSRTLINRISNRTQSIVWIAGDLNYPNIDWDNKTLKSGQTNSFSSLHREFLDTLDEFSLTQMVKNPTRDGNILDLFLTSNSSLVNHVRVVPGISDHDAVLVDSNITFGRVQQHRREIPLWKKADWESIRSHIDTAWNDLPENTKDGTAESLWSWFRETIEDSIRKFVPHRQAGKKDHHPWMSHGLKKLIKKSKKLFSKKQRCPTRPTINKYRHLQSHIQKRTRREYWEYINSILYPEDKTDTSDNSKRLWTLVKHSKTDSIGVAPLKNSHTGETMTDPKDKAECLNKQFQSAFSLRIPMKLSHMCKQTIWKSPNTPEDLKRKYPCMPAFTIGVNGIKKLLGTLKPHKAAGPDKLKPLLLKETRDHIAPILQVIFTKSLETGQLPSDWKTANVVPIYKKGPKYLPVNYRPVSLTCICSKLMEHIIVSQIGKHLQNHNILDKNQHGFLKGRSCETQLIEFIQDMHSSLEVGKQVAVVVMDFSKAFDKVPHNRLLYKLAEYGIEDQSLAWMKDFLIGRT